VADSDPGTCGGEIFSLPLAHFGTAGARCKAAGGETVTGIFLHGPDCDALNGTIHACVIELFGDNDDIVDCVLYTQEEGACDATETWKYSERIDMSAYITGFSSTSDYHDYVMDWSESEVVFIVDGVTIATITASESSGDLHGFFPTRLSNFRLTTWRRCYWVWWDPVPPYDEGGTSHFTGAFFTEPSSEEYYILSDGSGDFPTIQDAINASDDGDVITLADGIYIGNGNRDLDFSGKWITLRSESDNPSECVIDCEGSEVDPHRGVIFNTGEGSNTLLRGVTIQNGYLNGTDSGGGIYCYNSWPILENCIIRNNRAYEGGGLMADGASPTITGCIFIENDAEHGGGGAYFSNYSYAEVTECLFDSNQAISFGGAIFGWKFYGTLTSCTFAYNFAEDGGSIRLEQSSSINVSNCIIALSPMGGAVTGDGATFLCSDIFGNTGGDWEGYLSSQLGINGNINLDPEFCDPIFGNFHLTMGSPCSSSENPGCGQIGVYGVGCLPPGDEPWVDVTPDLMAVSTGSIGASWANLIGDDFPDLYVSVGYSGNLTYENTDASAEGFADASAPPLSDSGYSTSASCADYNNDGYIDLYLVNAQSGGQNHLFKNNGDGTYSEIIEAPVNHTGNDRAAPWVDIDNDGWVDLYLVGHGQNHLFVNVEGSYFEEIEDSPLTLDSFNSQGVAWGDYDNDGDQDVFVSNYGARSQLFINQGGFAFAVYTGSELVQNGDGRGCAWGDYDNDGDLDLYQAFEGQANHLYRNDDGILVDITQPPLDSDSNDLCVSWVDSDNDGDLDLYITRNGSNVLYENAGSDEFVEVESIPLSNDDNSRSSAWADFDFDGDLDVFIANSGELNALVENRSTLESNSLFLDLVGVESNKSAIGARVRIVTNFGSQIREVNAGSGFLAQDSPTIEFGLGLATAVDSVIITWPSGIRQTLLGVEANQILLVPEEVETDVIPPTHNRLSFYAYPNPFNPAVTFDISVPHEASLTCYIFDIAGKRVSVAFHETKFTPGKHSIVWTALGKNGERLPSGLYLASLSGQDIQQTQKIVLLK